MDGFNDPYGFTKQTATLLRGLGISELVPEFKKRNISTNVLHQLSIDELILLGVDPQKAKELKEALNVKRRKPVVVVSNENKIQHFLEIIKYGEHQLSLIQAFIVYSRLRLIKEQIDIFIDPNKCLSASEVLPISVRETLKEVEQVQGSLSELETLILAQSEPKPTRRNTCKICLFISGLGLATLVLFKIYPARL